MQCNLYFYSEQNDVYPFGEKIKKRLKRSLRKQQMFVTSYTCNCAVEPHIVQFQMNSAKIKNGRKDIGHTIRHLLRKILNSIELSSGDNVL